MKKMLLFAALVFSAHTFAKSDRQMSGFWGLNYGMDKAKVYSVMKSKVKGRNVTRLDKDMANQEANSLFFSNVEFAGNTFDTSLLSFNNKNQLKSGLFKKGYDESGEAASLFTYLKASLTDKYGDPTEHGSSMKLYWSEGTRRIELDILEQRGEYFVSVFYFTTGLPDNEITVHTDL